MAYLESKPRYEILDGLRGVASMMVILFHIFEIYCPHGEQQHINHGYLAVDFFFLLSGFVVGYAYDDRWGKMTTWDFCKRRLVRLHPMVVMGTLIGGCMLFFTAGNFPMVLEVSGWRIIGCFFMALFMLPCPPSMDIRGWGETNPQNGPNWSLTFEYIANILYAFLFRHLPTWALAVLVVVAGYFTLDLTLGIDLFNFLSAPHYHVKGSWSITADQIYIGFTRLLYPFLCGLLISRLLPSRMTKDNPSGSPISARGGFWWASLILVVIFSVPCITGDDGIANGIYQAAAILLVFPFVVLLGAGSSTTDPRSAKVCKFLGDISYPIYITHYPLMYMQMGFVKEHPDAPLWMHIAMNTGVFVMSILLAYCVMKAYDEPVREWLKRKWLNKKA